MHALKLDSALGVSSPSERQGKRAMRSPQTTDDWSAWRQRNTHKHAASSMRMLPHSEGLRRCKVQEHALFKRHWGAREQLPPAR